MAYFERIEIVGATGAFLDSPSGVTAPPNVLQVGGSDGTNLRPFSVDASGHVNVNAAQSGSWLIGVTGSGIGVTGVVSSAQSGTWTGIGVTGVVSAVQSGVWTGVGVTGTVTANAGTGNFIVVQPTGANLHVDIDNTVAISGSGIGVTGVVGAAQSGTWSGVGVTGVVSSAQSGVWSGVGVTGVMTAVQPTGANLQVLAIQPTGANLHVDVDNAVTVSGSGIGITGVVGAAQSGTWTGVGVTGVVGSAQSGTWAGVGVTGTVTVVQPTAANQQVLAMQPTGANLQVLAIQPTAANLNANVTQTGTWTGVGVTGVVGAAQSGTWSGVGVTGVVGAAQSGVWTGVGVTGVVSAAQSGTWAAIGVTGAVTVEGIYATSATVLSANQTFPLQLDYEGDLIVRSYRRSQTVAQATTIAATSAAIVCLATGATGVFNDISKLVVTPTAGATTSTAFTMTLSDGVANYIFDMVTGTSGATATAGAAPFLNIDFNPPLPETNSRTSWTLQNSSATPTVHATVVAVQQKIN